MRMLAHRIRPHRRRGRGRADHEPSQPAATGRLSLAKFDEHVTQLLNELAAELIRRTRLRCTVVQMVGGNPHVLWIQDVMDPTRDRLGITCEQRQDSFGASGLVFRWDGTSVSIGPVHGIAPAVTAVIKRFGLSDTDNPTGGAGLGPRGARQR